MLPRSQAVAGGKAVPGGTLLWADVDTPGTLWRARALRERLPVRLAVESGGAADPTESRWHLYMLASRWLCAAELETANVRLATLLGGDRVGDRDGSCACPEPATSRLDARGAGAAWWHATCTRRRSRSSRSWATCSTTLRSPRRSRHVASTRSRPTGLDDLAPRQWFALLEPDRPISEYGYARCPLHDDHIPSLKLYDEPPDGWYCWACARGGDIIEYAAWRWDGQSSRSLDPARFRALITRLKAALETPAPTRAA